MTDETELARTRAALAEALWLLDHAKSTMNAGQLEGLHNRATEITERIAALPVQFADVFAALPSDHRMPVGAVSPAHVAITFTVDMSRFVPAPADLRPHDYPLEVWVREAVGEMFFSQLKLKVQTDKLEAIAGDAPSETKKHLIEHCQALLETYTQAAATFDIAFRPADRAQ